MTKLGLLAAVLALAFGAASCGDGSDEEVPRPEIVDLLIAGSGLSEEEAECVADAVSEEFDPATIAAAYEGDDELPSDFDEVVSQAAAECILAEAPDESGQDDPGTD